MTNRLNLRLRQRIVAGTATDNRVRVASSTDSCVGLWTLGVQCTAIVYSRTVFELFPHGDHSEDGRTHTAVVTSWVAVQSSKYWT